MAFDFGEVLTRAWNITWNQKVLWVFGVIVMLLGLLFIPLGFAPVFSIFLSEDVPFWIEEPLYMLGYFALFLILFAVSFVIGMLVQAAISCGVLHAERGEEKLSFADVLRASYPFWGRFLGIALLYAGGISLVVFAFFSVQFLVSMVTLGLGAICMAPLQLLLYPFMLVAYAWLEQTQASIVVDDVGVFAAARRGWRVFRQNMLPVILVALIMYLGVGIISGFVSLPIMVPIFAFFFAGIENFEASRTVFLVSALCVVVYLPILAVFQSVALTFMKSGWILTYLQLTHNSETDVVISPAS
jgi:hypothetical protein